MIANRTEFSPQSLLGLVVVAAAIALALPGIQVARAEDGTALMSVDPVLDPAASPRPEAAPAARTCEVPSGPNVVGDVLADPRAQAVMREIVRRSAAQEAAPQSTQDVIVLNGRGYNYRTRRLPTGP